MKYLISFFVVFNLYANFNVTEEIPNSEWPSYSNQISSVQAGVTKKLILNKEQTVVQFEVYYVNPNTAITPNGNYDYIIIEADHFNQVINNVKDELGNDVVLKLSKEEHYVGQKAYRLVYTNQLYH